MFKRTTRQTSKRSENLKRSCSITGTVESKMAIENGTNQTSRTQWVAILNEDIVKNDPNVENKPVICKLRHPRTKVGALFLFSFGDQTVYEVLNFKEKYRSWFIGESVQQDGGILLTTPVDPVLLVLPYLMKAESSGKFMTLEQIFVDDDFPECNRLLSCDDLSELFQVTDCRGDDDFKAYKFDKGKTLSWLQRKTERVADVLEMKGHNVSGAHSAMYVRSKKSNTSTRDDFMRYAFGIICDYLPESLIDSLREHLGLPEVEVKSPSEPPAKKARIGDAIPNEDYSKGKLEEKTKTAKLTTAQKKLSQVDKAGMKNISSFFSPKGKSK